MVKIKLSETQNMIEKRLKKLGLSLPDTSTPGGNYVSLNIRAVSGFVAIQFPIINNEYFFQGRLGSEIDTGQGYEAMQLCALNVLAQIKKHLGFHKLLGINHLDIYYQSITGWDDGPRIADGASDLMVDILEEKGRHSRAIFGVANLPRNFSVGLTTTLTVK